MLLIIDNDIVVCAKSVRSQHSLRYGVFDFLNFMWIESRRICINMHFFWSDSQWFLTINFELFSFRRIQKNKSWPFLENKFQLYRPTWIFKFRARNLNMVYKWFSLWWAKIELKFLTSCSYRYGWKSRILFLKFYMKKKVKTISSRI